MLVEPGGFANVVDLAGQGEGFVHPGAGIARADRRAGPGGQTGDETFGKRLYGRPALRIQGDVQDQPGTIDQRGLDRVDAGWRTRRLLHHLGGQLPQKGQSGEAADVLGHPVGGRELRPEAGRT